ncbi:MAG TPA: hypothetical protein VF074_15695, partial [Pyrinomonadaceae bacterium]
AWVLWFLGLPDQSLQRIQEGLTLARDLSEPNGLAHAFCFAAILYQLRREHQMAQEHAEADIAVSREHGLVMYHAMATVIHGWSIFEQQRREEAIEEIRAGLEALQTMGTEFVRPHFLGLLAEALGKARQAEEGLRVLEEALALTHEQQCYVAELYRIKGELLLMQITDPGVSRAATSQNAAVAPEQPRIAQAEECFYQSIKIAQQQQAKSWELRSVMSLARLYQKQGKQEEARRLLTKVYGSFSEGFDTADLREAKTLLDELS